MKSSPKLFLSLFAAAWLAACTQTSGSSAPPAVAAAVPAPAGPGCSGEVARFRAVIDSDNATGNVNASIYKRMAADVDRAASVCAAGREGEAHASLSATKRRYGYP